MSIEYPLQRISLVAGADLSAKQYTAVVADSSTGNAVSAGAGVAILGVLQNAPVSGGVAGIETAGVTKFVLGGTVTPGQRVEVDSSGRAIALSSGIAVGYCLIGGAVNQIGSVKIY